MWNVSGNSMPRVMSVRYYILIEFTNIIYDGAERV